MIRKRFEELQFFRPFFLNRDMERGGAQGLLFRAQGSCLCAQETSFYAQGSSPRAQETLFRAQGSDPGAQETSFRAQGSDSGAQETSFCAQGSSPCAQETPFRAQELLIYVQSRLPILTRLSKPSIKNKLCFDKLI